MLSKRHIQWLIPLLVGALSFAFHLINLDHASYDLDEAVHIWHAQKSYSEVVEQASNDPNPPIYNLIISAWVKQFGVSEFSTRFFSVLMGVLGSLLIYFIGKRNFGFAVGLTAALLYSLSPIQFRFTHLARPYSMLMVTVLMSYGFLFECLKSNRPLKLMGYFFASTLMIYVHPTSVFNLPAQFLTVLLMKWKDWKSILSIWMVGALAVAMFLIWVFSIPYFERDDAMWFGAPDWQAVYYVIDVFYGTKLLLWIQILLFALMLLFAFKSNGRDDSTSRGLVMVLPWVIAPFAISIAFSHLVKPVFQDKYVLSVQPALMLMLAVSIGAIPSKVMRGISMVVCLLLMVSVADFERDPEGDWKNAVSYLKSQKTEGDAVFIGPWYEFRTFSFYYNRHFFEVPDSTVKLLAEQDIFYAWHDIYDTTLSEFKYPILHVLSAHEGFVESRLDELAIKAKTRLVEEEKFIGITYRQYNVKSD